MAPAPATTVAGSIPGGLGLDGGMERSSVNAGGMLKGQRSSPKSYSKTSFKGSTAVTTAASGGDGRGAVSAPGGGYLSNISNTPSSDSSSVSSIAGPQAMTTSTGETSMDSKGQSIGSGDGGRGSGSGTVDLVIAGDVGVGSSAIDASPKRANESLIDSDGGRGIIKGGGESTVSDDVQGSSEFGFEERIILKGSTAAASEGKIFGKGPSTRFGLGSFKKGNGAVLKGKSSIGTTDNVKGENEFLSDLVQATVPSNMNQSTSTPMLDATQGGSPSQLASIIPLTSPVIQSPTALGTPVGSAGVGAAQPRPPQSQSFQQIATSAVRIGSATRLGSLTAFENASQGNASQRGLSPKRNDVRVIRESSTGINIGSVTTDSVRGLNDETKRPQSVTITDPRTGKQRTISVSANANNVSE